jgi:hypothetical protein
LPGQSLFDTKASTLSQRLLAFSSPSFPKAIAVFTTPDLFLLQEILLAIHLDDHQNI